MHGWMTPDHVYKSTGPRTESENDTRNPIQSTTCPTATCPPITAPPRTRRIPRNTPTPQDQQPAHRPRNRPNPRTKPRITPRHRNQSTPTPTQHAPDNRSTTTKPRNTNVLLVAQQSDDHARLAAARTCGPNPRLRTEDQSSPHRHRTTNHDTTTNPQNTNNPTHNDNQPPSDEPLRPPGSTNQIRNRNRKTNPVHNRGPTTIHRRPRSHRKTTNFQ